MIMLKDDDSKGHGFGTAPVFLAAINTILGAILFLRFGYAVANVGLLGAFLIILLGHTITIPTALAVSEIATNLRVRGGGEYYITSRSFGSMIGGTIGMSLYAAQAISISFYMIAFSEAFTPFFGFFQDFTGIAPDIRMISIPATVALVYIMYRKGAKIGVNALYLIAAVIGFALLLFLMGNPITDETSLDFFATVENPHSFFLVFAIIFPAFTGMTAGVGLSGDLKNPGKAIPLGTVAATLGGMIVYIIIILKLAYSATPDQLASNQLVMADIALWGPIILIGLACATLSSAIGSSLIAPRTMQALAKDKIFPSKIMNSFLGKGVGEVNEPMNATIVTSVIAVFFVAIGSVDFVAQIISMFFMITYGSICLVSFLQHFAGNVSYQPTFRSRWYISLTGAIMCLFMMFQMSPFYAAVSILAMAAIYTSLKSSKKEDYDLTDMVTGAFFQLSRKIRVIIQHTQMDSSYSGWRPSFIGICSSTFKRLSLFDILRWFSHYYGFGTYMHYVKGELSQDNKRKSRRDLEELIKLGSYSKASIYVDTIIATKFKYAVEHLVQMPGISGMENNSLLVEYNSDEKDNIQNIIDACRIAAMMSFNICVLRPSGRRFGYKKNIHVWMTPEDYRNAKLMITLSYILMENPEWKGCNIEIFSAIKKDDLEKHMMKLNSLMESGEIPLSPKMMRKVEYTGDDTALEDLVEKNSEDADIVILGLSIPKVEASGEDFFKRFSDKDLLFVRAGQKISISEPKTE
jgi:amino acid transporter